MISQNALKFSRDFANPFEILRGFTQRREPALCFAFCHGITNYAG